MLVQTGERNFWSEQRGPKEGRAFRDQKHDPDEPVSSGTVDIPVRTTSERIRLSAS
jgi:hypothetical protein